MSSLFHSSILTYFSCFVCLNFWYHYKARAKEYDLIEMRKQINSIRGEHEVRKEFEREDSRRTERVDELETKEKTMASYRGKIVNLRQKAKPMSNDFVDRQFQKAQKMVEKKTAMNR